MTKTSSFCYGQCKKKQKISYMPKLRQVLTLLKLFLIFQYSTEILDNLVSQTDYLYDGYVLHICFHQA